MFNVRIKTTDGKLLAGPSYADDFAGALKDAEESAESAGKEIGQVFIKARDGEKAGITLKGEKGSTVSRKKK